MEAEKELEQLAALCDGAPYPFENLTVPNR